jgi:hypothetical protein
MKTILISFLLFLFLAACGGNKSSALPNLTTATDTTDECRYMLEVCGEARSFEREYGSMSEEERKSMTSVLNNYIELCEGSEGGCIESVEEK